MHSSTKLEFYFGTLLTFKNVNRKYMDSKNLNFEKQNKISDTKAENKRRVLEQKFPKQPRMQRSSIVVGAIT